MACRPGPLRAVRSLRDVYAGFAVGLPLVGMKIFDCDQRERQPKEYTSHEVTVLRAGGPRGGARFGGEDVAPPP